MRTDSYHILQQINTVFWARLNLHDEINWIEFDVNTLSSGLLFLFV